MSSSKELNLSWAGPDLLLPDLLGSNLDLTWTSADPELDNKSFSKSCLNSPLKSPLEFPSKSPPPLQPPFKHLLEDPLKTPWSTPQSPLQSPLWIPPFEVWSNLEPKKSLLVVVGGRLNLVYSPGLGLWVWAGHGPDLDN